MRLEYLLSGADLSEMRSACLSGFGDWIRKRNEEGEGPGGLIPVTGVTADETESCSSVG